MTDFRSEAERFVTSFLDYVQEHDILDFFNKRMGKMERSPGIDTLIRQAESVFPRRADNKPEDNGQLENDKLSAKQVETAVTSSPNVVDTREMFARKVQANGGTRSLLRKLYADEPGARDRVREFLEAEDGEKDFGQ